VALLPFKVYVLTAYFSMFVYLSALPRPRDYDSELFAFAILGYAVCFFVLCCASIGQGLAAKRRDSAVSLAFAVLAVIFGYLLLPGLAH
jgi:hypothetical protein